MYYIYSISDPRKQYNRSHLGINFEYEPFYIGKGTGNRPLHHLREAKDETVNNPKVTKIRKLWKLNLEPIITEIIYFDNEKDAYDFEEKLIKDIGSNFCPDVKHGTLCNIVKSNFPPNLKGKTYQDIYGDRAQEQIEKRRKIQLERGGFGPKKFSEEVKKKLSVIQSGTGNGHYGKKHSEEAKRKIGESASKTQQWLHKGQIHTIEDPNGNQYTFFGTLEYFCEINNISRSTLDVNYRKGKVCTRGKTKGWKILSKI